MLWGGYTVKILISGTTKQEQHLTTWQHLWVPQKHLGACVVLAVVSFQLRHLITPSPKSERHRWFVWALLSPLLSPSQKIARDPDVDSLEAGGSRTQSSSFANRFGLAFVTFSRWWGGRGKDGGVSGLGVQQPLVCREDQQSSDVLCESEQTLLLHLSLANKGTRPWSTHRIRASLELQQAMELTPCVLCFHTFPDCEKYLYWAVWTLCLAHCYDLPLIFISAYFRIQGLDTFGFVYYENRRNFIPWTNARSISKK